MNTMRYEAPKTLEAAVALLAGANGQARVLAGGTDLLIQMRGGRVEPELLVDIKGIPEMTSIVAENGAYRFGAAVPCMELVEHKAFAKAWPGVTDGANLIGSIQVKGRATVGGNLCNASPAADSVPALIAAGAIAQHRRARTAGARCRSRRSPRDRARLRSPKARSSRRSCCRSARRARAMPIFASSRAPRWTSRSSARGSTSRWTTKGVCTQARVSLGAVAERALLVPEAAAALIGTKVDADALKRMAAAVSAACRPIDDKRGTKEYRIKVAGVMARRAAEIALERARRTN